MAGLPPVHIGEPPFVRDDGVAEDSVVHALLDGLKYFGGSLKVHVGDPHGKLAVFYIPLDGTGVVPVYDCIKIVFHS